MYFELINFSAIKGFGLGVVVKYKRHQGYQRP